MGQAWNGTSRGQVLGMWEQGFPREEDDVAEQLCDGQCSLLLHLGRCSHPETATAPPTPCGSGRLEYIRLQGALEMIPSTSLTI